MSRELVIAHYQENLDWLHEVQQVFPNLKITVYNKSNFTFPNVTNIELPNVGREAHTYLYHIVNNYDTLADFTIFCQGNPFDHIKKETFYNVLRSDKAWVPLRYQEIVAPLNYDIFFPDTASSLGNTFLTWWNKYLNTNSNVLYKVVWNAQFLVHKLLIQQRSIDFYKSLLMTLNHDSGALEAHFLERTWGNIFTDFEIVYPDVKDTII